MRTRLPFVVMLVFAVFLLGSYFFPEAKLGGESYQSVSGSIMEWAVIVAAWAIGVAALNITMFHTSKIRTRSKDWVNSIFFLALEATCALSVILNRFAPSKFSAYLYDNIFTYFFQVSGNAVFSLTAFFVASAAYRAFRARTPATAFMLVAGLLIILGSCTLGEAIWVKLTPISQWVTSVPNMAGQRGLIICGALGGFTMGLRVILGIDRSSYGS